MLERVVRQGHLTRAIISGGDTSGHAASALGLRTAHIARVNEYGPGTGEAAPKVPVDFAASSLVDLAGKLGA